MNQTPQLTYQKVIANDDWDNNMQRQIDEAFASTEMPAQLDQRFIKRSQDQEESQEDVEMKEIEKSKPEQKEEPASNQEEDIGSDVSLDDDQFDNLIKELESHDPDNLIDEMRAKLTEAQKAKKEKLEKYIKNQGLKEAKKKEKKKKGKEKPIEITPMAPTTPGKVTNRKNSADTPKTSQK